MSQERELGSVEELESAHYVELRRVGMHVIAAGWMRMHKSRPLLEGCNGGERPAQRVFSQEMGELESDQPGHVNRGPSLIGDVSTQTIAGKFSR